ncbi:MAG: hypothetical protein IMX01_05235 [Limnochordaceae bacterium]|nr:hypothetical protein [Limnochordaceae bacterium]
MPAVNEERRRLRQEYFQKRRQLVQSFAQALTELGREYRRQRAQLFARACKQPEGGGEQPGSADPLSPDGAQPAQPKQWESTASAPPQAADSLGD